MRGAVLATADAIVGTASKRALRWGGDWHMPMLVGQQTTPLVLQAVAGFVLTKDNDSAKVEKYLAALYTTCDYFLGCNALNMTGPPAWARGIRGKCSIWMPGIMAKMGFIQGSFPTVRGERRGRRVRGRGMSLGRTRRYTRPSMLGRETNAGSTTGARP